ncbi:MAG: glutathione S-transferase family protein [Hyphomicrobiales bacterium]
MTDLRLRFSPTSPYVRKVRVFAAEAGLTGAIELVASNPYDPATDLVNINPLGKVPALESRDGVFIGSMLICLYLDTRYEGPRLIPTEPKERWPVLQLHALAEGTTDATVAILQERGRRPAEKLHPPVVERQLGKIVRTVAAIDRQVRQFAERVDLGTIAVGCALGFLDLRFGEFDWRSAAPPLRDWYAGFSQRPSMVLTKPPEA